VKTLSFCRVAVAALSLSFTACECGQSVRRTFPKLEVLDAMGAERGSVDFGQVQLNSTAAARVRVRNAGNATLNLTKTTFSNVKFVVGETLPVAIEPNGELMFAFTFRPTEPDLRETGTVTVETDDPARPTVQLTLLGTGIAAVATVMPRVLDFGEVYVNESKALEVTLTNAGSNELEVTAATLSATVAGLTGMPQTLVGALAAGASKKGRADLAEKTGLSEKLVLEWVNRADLMRIKGIGSQYSDLLEHAGVDSVPELAQRNGANLAAKMAEINEAKNLTNRAPSEKEVEDWVEQAKGLDRVVTH